jgi:hypothetical protein
MMSKLGTGPAAASKPEKAENEEFTICSARLLGGLGTQKPKRLALTRIWPKGTKARHTDLLDWR